MNGRGITGSLFGALSFLLLTWMVVPCWAQAVQERRTALDDLVFATPEARPRVQNQDLNEVRPEARALAYAAMLESCDAFLSGEGRGWEITIERASGMPGLMEGRGIPWIPGTANQLDAQTLGLNSGSLETKATLNFVAQKALQFLKDYPGLVAAAPADLRIMRGASGPISDYLYFLDLQWLYHGIPVDRAHVVFRLNHGNLIQFGQEYVSRSIESLDPAPTISRETAWEVLWGYLGGQAGEVKISNPGTLLIVPVATKAALEGTPVRPGSGLAYRLVYALPFRTPETGKTWEARVDAHTGEILSFESADILGGVRGGVYPSEQPVAESKRAMPFADIGGGLYADAGGHFAGSAATSTLAGQYVTVSDKCGAISLATADGNLDFGSGAGTDCTTPGFGGAGNTHASRTLYYTINLFKMKALSYFPGNAWLNGNVTGKVNLTSADSSYCPGNGWWDGTFINLCISNATYGNTGEEPGFLLHEIGHGLDSNDGNGGSPDNGSGEAYGDTNAFLQSHNSCVGSGFRLTGNCGYGDLCTSCNGLRDVDWGRHTSNTPHTVDNFTRVDCWSSSYAGMCGYEGHCESYIMTEATWDLAVRDLPAAGFDAATSWMIVDKLWYRSRSTATGGFTCNTGSIPWTSNGCGVGSLYTVLRAVDDTDGNVANGTPHAAAIFAALNRHGIACGAAGDPANQNQSTCPAIGTPIVSGTLGTNQVSLSWTAAANAASYDVYRNEVSCGSGFTRLGTVPGLTYTDTTALGGITYYYSVQAIGASAACMGAMSPCFTIGGPLSATASGVPTEGIATLTVNFTGAGVNGTPPYTYSWDYGDGSPAGSGTTPSHSYTNLGIHTVTLTVTDSASPAVVVTAPTFTIKVCGNNTATPASFATATAGTPYTVTFTGGGGVGPYTFTLTGALPTGLTFVTDTLSGTPMQLGTFPLTLRVTDANGCFTDLSYSLTVICPVITITPTALSPAIFGKKYCQQLTASGCVGSCTFTISAGMLPAGLTMDSTGYISGIPTVHGGTFNFTVTATTILGCHGDQAYSMKMFDLIFVDDYGRSRFYVDGTTGTYEWDILKGMGLGVYTGVLQVLNGKTLFKSFAVDPNVIYITYDPYYFRAKGYLSRGFIYSPLTDMNTQNNLSPCP
jgi:trimeric autotransporter adhesin